jgi:hypothetical protein
MYRTCVTDVADSQQQIIANPVEPRREYVAGSAHWLAYVGAVRALPHAVDELEAELGDDLYTRMLTDPRVRGDVRLLKGQILSDGVTVSPAITPDGDDAAAETARAASAFVERCLANLTIPLTDVLRDLLDALAYGSRVAEQIYAAGEGESAGRLVLRAIKPKPRKATAFVVDAWLNVLGLLAAEPGRPLTIGMVALGQTNTPPANMLPRAKFAILTYSPKDSDPRGSTILRAAYNWWWIKTQLLPELLKFGAQFGTPSLWATTAERAVSNDPTKSPEQELFEKLLAFQGGTAASFPYGTDLHSINLGQGGETFFERVISLCDAQISTGIYGATRATQEAQYGSRADSGTAKDLFDVIVEEGRQAIATMLQRDVVDPLIAYNDAAWAAYVPRISVGGVQAEDRTPAWTAAAGLERAGYLDPSQYQQLDADLGLPVRSPAEVEERRSRKSAPPVVAPPAAPGQAPGDDPNPDQGGQ